MGRSPLGFLVLNKTIFNEKFCLLPVSIFSSFSNIELSFNCNKIYLKYKSHEKEMPFRKGKKDLWEEKRTMNYFSYICDETPLPWEKAEAAESAVHTVSSQGSRGLS